MIQVENLSWKYSGSEKEVLKDINLTIGDGEFICIVGPNDSGKTTLAMALNGLIPNNYYGIMEGRVLVEGLDTREHDVAELSKYVGFVFSDPESQFLSMTVEEELAFGLENQGLGVEEIEERIRWAMEFAGIPEEYLEKPPYELSGGEKQRVAIASVLAMKPKTLILDEPTSMLDPIGKTEVIRVLRELKKSYNATIIVIEHRLDDIAGLADRMILLYKGRILRDQKPREFFNDISFLLEHDIFPPEAMVLLHKLREEGYYRGDIPLTLEEAVEACRKIIG